MPRKGEVIAALIELSRTRQLLRACARSYAENAKPQRFLTYHQELDGALALLTKAVRASIAPRKPRGRAHGA